MDASSGKQGFNHHGHESARREPFIAAPGASETGLVAPVWGLWRGNL